jgi:glycosidase
MVRPLVLEINTQCWLRELSENANRAVTLATVPDGEFVAWKNSGFTHIWLMGIWTTGPKTCAASLARPELRELCREAFGPGGEEHLGSSPYAIADYTAANFTGGPDALAQVRARLRQHGIGLILDFVPNHFGLDHPWIEEKPGLFVQSPHERPETFPVATPDGTIWVAHGKDPNFPAWNDTAQLDYRNPSTRSAMMEVLKSIAGQCDGVRCDMAMLLLGDVFEKTWRDFPSTAPSAVGEFWPDAITAVKRSHPAFLFIAEAYWNLEPRLAALGFDYVYDKIFYDLLTRRDSAGLEAHVRAKGGFEPVRFLENHDEARLASVLSPEEEKAAAIFLMRQPGMRLLQDGQLIGRKRGLPVQFTRYWPEPPDPDIADFYGVLLKSEAGRTQACWDGKAII